MIVLFIGDIVGKSSREKVKQNITNLRKKYSPDVIIANAENATSGYGLSKKDAEDLLQSGIDILTLGNHAWDQREMLSFIEECPKIVRAINFPPGVPGKGYYSLELINGKKITVIQVMLRLFMGLFIDDPFRTTKEFLEKEKLGLTTNSIIVDLHGEATSEKNAFAQYFDGSVTAVLGTHTHIPTSDDRILSNGTAYQTDVGMTGDYNSVIGMDISNPIHSFTKGFRAEGRFKPATENISICGAIVKVNDDTGLSEEIHSFKEK